MRVQVQIVPKTDYTALIKTNYVPLMQVQISLLGVCTPIKEMN